MPEHDINDLRFRREGDRYVVVCKCGWETKPATRAEDAVKEWQRHRDRF